MAKTFADGFPDDFTYEELTALSRQIVCEEDRQELAACREMIYKRVSQAAMQHANNVKIAFGARDTPAIRYHVTKELDERFPGRVYALTPNEGFRHPTTNVADLGEYAAELMIQLK